MMHLYLIAGGIALVAALTSEKKKDNEKALENADAKPKESENATPEPEPNLDRRDRGGDRGGDCSPRVGTPDGHEHESGPSGLNLEDGERATEAEASEPNGPDE